MKFAPVLLAGLVLLAGGCLMPLPPTRDEARLVTSITNTSSKVIFKEAMIWTDQLPAFASRGIRFPEGTYLLEAEDKEYWYYRAPTNLEYRVFKNGQVVDDRFMPGGLYLMKAKYNLIPAGAYLAAENHTNVLTWKLGGDFLRREGSKWIRVNDETR